MPYILFWVGWVGVVEQVNNIPDNVSDLAEYWTALGAAPVIQDVLSELVSDLVTVLEDACHKWSN